MIPFTAHVAGQRQVMDDLVHHAARGAYAFRNELQTQRRREQVGASCRLCVVAQEAHHAFMHALHGQIRYAARQMADPRNQGADQVQGKLRVACNRLRKPFTTDYAEAAGRQGLHRRRARGVGQHHFPEALTRAQRIESDFAALRVVEKDAHAPRFDQVERVCRVTLQHHNLLSGNTAQDPERAQRSEECIRLSRHR